MLPDMVPGEQGFVLLKRLGAGDRVVGQVTGFVLPFDKKSELYVDIRDAVFLLGVEYGIV